MTASSFLAQLKAFLDKAIIWCLWFGKLVVAIGIAYAAARIFAFGNVNVNGINIPVPRVSAEVTQLAYLAGCIWLISR